MKVVNPNNTTHTIELIPRYYSTDTLTFLLTNETTKAQTEVSQTNTNVNGLISFTFDFTFSERDKYTVKITDVSGVVYRGNIFATDQESQDFNILENYYIYE